MSTRDIRAHQRITTGPIASTRTRIGARRGGNIRKVAAARKLLTLVYYGLRDVHIRALPALRRRGRAGQDAAAVHLPRARRSERDLLACTRLEDAEVQR